MNRFAATNRFAMILLVVLSASACGPDAGQEEGTSAPTRKAPTPAVLASSGGSHPTVAFDPAGETAYVAWVGSSDEGETWNVLLARSDAADGPGEPVRVNDVPGDAAPHEQAPPQVRVAPDGTVYVVWQTTRWVEGREFPASDLRLARSTDGGRSFEPAASVNSDAGQLPASHTFHDLAVTPDGTLLVSWIDTRERARAEAQRAQGEEASGEDDDSARIPGDVRVARSTDRGETFETAKVVDLDPCPCCRTALAAAPDGAAYVAWRKTYEGDVRDIVVARSEDGGRGFGAPARVADDGWVIPGCPHAGPALAVDTEGRLHVAWYTGKEGGPGVFHAVSRDGGRSFDAPRALVTGDRVPPSRVHLRPGADGTMWAVFEDRAEIPGRVRVARLLEEADGGFRVEHGPAVEGSYPAMDVGETPGAYVAWTQGEAVLAAAGW